MVAAMVRDHDVGILDMRLDGDLDGALGGFAPDVVGVTALTQEVNAARDVLRRVKAFSPEIVTVVGGHHATLVPTDYMVPSVDLIALGEGEVVFRRLVDALESRFSLRGIPGLLWRDVSGRFEGGDPPGKPIDTTALPFPRRDLTAALRSEYHFLFDRPDTSIATSRGCPFHCKFCSVHEFYHGATSQMSPERVLAELRTVPTDHVTFVDDNFLMNWRRETELAERIRAEGIRKRYAMECRTDSIVRHPELVEKWAEIGLTGVLLGLEGGSDQTLDRVDKRCSVETNNEAIRILQGNDVVIWGAFIVDPDWGEDDFLRLGDYVAEMGITHRQFTILTPLPGTELYRERYHELLTHDYACFDTLHAVLPTRLPRTEFYQRFAALYRQHDIGPYYDLVRAGRMTVDDCRRGKALLDTLAQWERYIEGDPILGGQQPCATEA
jgi:radical SAM superfamily enzyme YgiQ (UPF0313 family)